VPAKALELDASLCDQATRESLGRSQPLGNLRDREESRWSRSETSQLATAPRARIGYESAQPTAVNADNRAKAIMPRRTCMRYLQICFGHVRLVSVRQHGPATTPTRVFGHGRSSPTVSLHRGTGCKVQSLARITPSACQPRAPARSPPAACSATERRGTGRVRTHRQTGLDPGCWTRDYAAAASVVDRVVWVFS
jgi:hypothetical protein